MMRGESEQFAMIAEVPPLQKYRILSPMTIATHPGLPSIIPAGEPPIIPVVFRCFRVLFRPGFRFSGKVVQPDFLRALLYQFSHR